jgi:hypothetical protein
MPIFSILEVEDLLAKLQEPAGTALKWVGGDKTFNVDANDSVAFLNAENEKQAPQKLSSGRNLKALGTRCPRTHHES